MKGWIWPFFRKIFILIGIMALLIYGAGKVNWTPMEDWMIDKLAHLEPRGKQVSLLSMDGKLSITDTIAYKRKS